MKIYEVRDITDDESYYTKCFFLTPKEAIDSVMELGHTIADFTEYGESVVIAVYEHEIGSWSHEDSFGKQIFEVRFNEEHDEEKDENEWKSEITKEYVEQQS